MELARKGPGLLLRDILTGEDPAVLAVQEVLAHADPDIVLLTGIDWDLGLAAVRALTEPLDYPHLFGLRPNSGMPTGRDMDGDGRLGGPRDAQGYGWFSGQGGMALLSRVPVDAAGVRSFSEVPWRDLPYAQLPKIGGAPFPSEEALAVQRLSSVAHWDVPVVLPSGERLHLLTFAATTPVFDGPEDRNGLRNHDEVMFWTQYLNGALDWSPPKGPVIVLGNANLDPVDGHGRREAVLGLLSHPRLQDPEPRSAGGTAAAEAQGGVNARHSGPPEMDTADWRDENGPGNLRVSYVLPDRRLQVTGSGVFWPAPEDPLHRLVSGEGLPRHRLVWVDVEIGAGS